MFSFDEDMLQIANQWQREGRNFTGVITARPIYISVGECIRDLEFLAKVGYLDDFENEVFYLPLKTVKIRSASRRR
jgi:hypothetical protein